MCRDRRAYLFSDAIPAGFFDNAEDAAKARNTTVEVQKQAQLEWVPSTTDFLCGYTTASLLWFGFHRNDWAAFQEFAASVPEPVEAPEEAVEQTDLDRDVSVADEQMYGIACHLCDPVKQSVDFAV
jgi:hypothetical protein